MQQTHSTHQHFKTGAKREQHYEITQSDGYWKYRIAKGMDNLSLLNIYHDSFFLHIQIDVFLPVKPFIGRYTSTLAVLIIN